jgi:hypothetical protein
MARKGPQVFKVAVKYADDAHDPQIIAVTRNDKIRTAQDAEEHCKKVLHHRDPETFEEYPCIEAKAVRPEPFSIDEAPMTPDAAAAIKAQTVVQA